MASTTNPLKQAFSTPKAVTANKTLTGTDSGTAWTNTNATGSITFTLPKAAVGLTSVVSGLTYQFLVNAAHNIVITPKTGDTIRGLAAGGSLTLSTVGQVVQLEQIASGFWDIVAGNTFGSINTFSGPSTFQAEVFIEPTTGVTSLAVIGNGVQNAVGITGGAALSPLVIDGTSSTGYAIIFQDGATEYGGIGPGARNVTGAPLASMCLWAFNGPVILGGFNGSYIALQVDSTGSQAGVTITADAATALQVNGVASHAPLTLTNFAANTAAVNYTNAAFTGTQIATFTAANKPGTATTAPSLWLPIQLNGTTYFQPCWL
jgi:hypothetical protein